MPVRSRAGGSTELRRAPPARTDRSTGTSSRTRAGVTVVDCRHPGLLGRSSSPRSRTMGRSLDDVAALVLTHAHTDHTGVAGKLHERGVPVYVHPADDELLRDRQGALEARGQPAAGDRDTPGIGASSSTWRATVRCSPPKIADSIAIADGERSTSPGAHASSTRPATRPGHARFTSRASARCSWATCSAPGIRSWAASAPRSCRPPSTSRARSASSRCRGSRASTRPSCCPATASPGPRGPAAAVARRGRRGPR